MNRGSLVCLAAAALLCALAPSRARALDEQHSPLAWHAPAGCPSQDELGAMIRGLISAGLPQYDDLSVQARVEQGTEQWQARITIATADGRGVRNLSADNCHKLADATALYVAVALDGIAAAQRDSDPWSGTPAGPADPVLPQDPDTPWQGESNPPPAIEPAAPPKDAAPQTERKSRAKARRSTRLSKAAKKPKKPLSKRIEFGVDALVHSGVTAAIHPGMAARLSLQLARFRFQLGLHWLPERMIYADGTQRDGPAILTWGLGPSLEACWLGRLKPRQSRPSARSPLRWSVPVCAATAVLVVVGHGRQVPLRDRVQADWAGVGATSGFEFEHRFFSVRLGIGAYLSVSRPNFEVAKQSTIQSFPVTAQITLGIGFGG